MRVGSAPAMRSTVGEDGDRLALMPAESGVGVGLTGRRSAATRAEVGGEHQSQHYRQKWRESGEAPGRGEAVPATEINPTVQLLLWQCLA